MTGGSSGPVSFRAHIELLGSFLQRRESIVASVQALLDAQKKPTQFRQDKASLARLFEDAFHPAQSLPGEQLALRGQLQQAHWASGFTPRAMPGLHNDLADAGEMMVRAFNLWRQTRWPGPGQRLRFAHALFNLHLLRQLELLVMRIWDAGSTEAAARLAQVQAVLDALWQSTPPGLPVMVRDACWLIPIAQSPTTDALHPYFDVAGQLADSLTEEDRLEVHRATVVLAGGHLRSQLRHYNMQGTPLDEPSLVLSTRRSNALDFSMTVQGLVPLLKAYVGSCHDGDAQRRQLLAGAIMQGISADPELFVNRLDLLGPYTMIETLFVTVDARGQASLTPMGERHVALLREYAQWIVTAAPLLHADAPAFRPAAGMYSPHGVLYGFSSNILEHMTIRTLVEPQAPPFSLEEAFTEGAPGSGKLEWVSGWRRLPHIARAVQEKYQYPLQFAQQVFDRIAHALQQRASDTPQLPTGRLVIAGEAAASVQDVPPLPLQYLLSSDLQLVGGFRARACAEADLLHDRFEGEFAVSYQTPGGWVGVSKDFLTDILGVGRDARLSGLPPGAASVLALMCQGLTRAA